MTASMDMLQTQSGRGVQWPNRPTLPFNSVTSAIHNLLEEKDNTSPVVLQSCNGRCRKSNRTHCVRLCAVYSTRKVNKFTISSTTRSLYVMWSTVSVTNHYKQTWIQNGDPSWRDRLLTKSDIIFLSLFNRQTGHMTSQPFLWVINIAICVIKDEHISSIMTRLDQGDDINQDER